MKTLLVAALAISLTSCGMVSDNCDGDVCHALFGQKNSDQDDKLKALDAQQDSLVQQLQINSNYLLALLELYEMQSANGLASAGARIDALELDLANVNISLLELQSNVQVYGILQPCGDTPGVFDEILLDTSSGIVASFSDNANGKNTRFSVLTDGTYQVTDGTGCVFTIQNGGLL
jgi:hypothetical protein